jgi:hypothetical protein
VGYRGGRTVGELARGGRGSLRAKRIVAKGEDGRGLPLVGDLDLGGGQVSDAALLSVGGDEVQGDEPWRGNLREGGARRQREADEFGHLRLFYPVASV